MRTNEKPPIHKTPATPEPRPKARRLVEQGLHVTQMLYQYMETNLDEKADRALHRMRDHSITSMIVYNHKEPKGRRVEGVIQRTTIERYANDQLTIGQVMAKSGRKTAVRRKDNTSEAEGMDAPASHSF